MEEKQNEIRNLLTNSKQKVSYEISAFIIKVVKMYYNLDDTYIETKSRKVGIVVPRQMAMYLIRKHTSLSLHEIGRIFGKDHATVLHSDRKIKDYLFYDKEIKTNVKELERIIKFKATAINEDVDWKKDYYYLDMDSFHSVNLVTPNQAIIMTGFSKEEVEKFSRILAGVKDIRTHDKTGMYILEKNNTNSNDDERKQGEKT